MYRPLFDGNLSDSVKYIVLAAALICLAVTAASALFMLSYKFIFHYSWEVVKAIAWIIGRILDFMDIKIIY